MHTGLVGGWTGCQAFADPHKPCMLSSSLPCQEGSQPDLIHTANATSCWMRFHHPASALPPLNHQHATHTKACRQHAMACELLRGLSPGLWSPHKPRLQGRLLDGTQNLWHMPCSSLSCKLGSHADVGHTATAQPCQIKAAEVLGPKKLPTQPSKHAVLKCVIQPYFSLDSQLLLWG